MRCLKNKRGEGYIDTAVTVLIVAFIMVLMVNIVSLVALNQNMKSAADRIAEYASLKGTTDVRDFVSEMQEKLGVDFTCSFAGSERMSGSDQVQLGDRIVCTLTYSLNFPGFGDATHRDTVTATAVGFSRVYWK